MNQFKNTALIEYEQLIEDLQAALFVMHDLDLYLDTHPDDSEAITQYNEYYKYKKELVAYIEARFGPIEQYAENPTSNQWAWAKAPWPWQL